MGDAAPPRSLPTQSESHAPSPVGQAGPETPGCHRVDNRARSPVSSTVCSWLQNTEGVSDELFGGKVRSVEVASRQTNSANVEFSSHPYRRQLQLPDPTHMFGYYELGGPMGTSRYCSLNSSSEFASGRYDSPFCGAIGIHQWDLSSDVLLPGCQPFRKGPARRQ